jgi:hypothetical protein
MIVGVSFCFSKHKGIEEIKKKYAKDKPSESHLETPPKVNNAEFQKSYDQKSDGLKIKNDMEDPAEDSKEDQKKVGKSLKIKHKGEKENVLKTIKLKMK